MAAQDDHLRTLREALKVSPDNVPLRQHVAETLLRQGQADEAEKEFRQALSLAPDNVTLKVGLAKAFYEQGKYSPALVIVEDLLKAQETPPAAYLLHARLLISAGEVQRAVRQYREAIELDPSLADPALAETLGIDAEE